MKARVLGIVINSCINESRVFKQGNTLKNNGLDFEIVALHSADLKLSEKISNIEISRIDIKFRKFMHSKFILCLKKFAPFIKILHVFAFLEFIIKVIVSFRKFDFLHCYSLAGLIVGVCYKISKPGIKIIYDAREYETETMSSVGIWRKIRRIVESICIKFADSVITVSDNIANEYERLYGIKKPYLVLNCPKIQKLKSQDLFRKKFKIGKDKIIFLYQGALFKGRGVDSILEIFSSLPKSSKAVCVFMGYGNLVSKIKKYSKAHHNVFYHESVSPDIVLDYTSSADVGLCLIENKCLSYYYCLPNKLFEYAMAGLPIIGSDLPEIRKVIQEYKVGLVTSEENPSEILEIVKGIDRKKIMQWQKGLPSLVKKYNWENQESTLLKVYNEK